MKKNLLLLLLPVWLLADAPTILPAAQRSFNQSQFMPDMSMMVDTSYAYRNIQSSELGHLEIPEISHGILGSDDHDGHGHTGYNSANGFNFNYAEMVISSSVDPYFTLDGILHFSEDGVDIEEAYVTSTSLPYGLRARAGKMLSNFGRINAQHHHYWDFGDMPLVYDAFTGNHGINEKGLQLQYNVPVPFYAMFGYEIMQGENESMFGISALGDTENPYALGADAPALNIVYLKSSFDVGDTTVLGGISYAAGLTRLDHSSDEVPHALAGNSSLAGIDLTIKHYLNSYSFISLQSEWLQRNMEATLYTLDANNTNAVTGTSAVNKQQSGFYTQLIYAMNQNWRTGLRYDLIYQNDVREDTIKQDLEDNFPRYSFMAEYHPSEFSRIRLQYNRNIALFNENGERVDLHELTLQLNFAIGAHAAHSF